MGCCWSVVSWLLGIGGCLLAYVEAWSLAMTLDFAFEKALDELGEATLLTLGQCLSGFFDFGVQCDVGFFSHSKIHSIVLKSIQYFSFKWFVVQIFTIAYSTNRPSAILSQFSRGCLSPSGKIFTPVRKHSIAICSRLELAAFHASAPSVVQQFVCKLPTSPNHS